MYQIIYVKSSSFTIATVYLLLTAHINMWHTKMWLKTRIDFLLVKQKANTSSQVTNQLTRTYLTQQGLFDGHLCIKHYRQTKHLGRDGEFKHNGKVCKTQSWLCWSYSLFGMETFMGLPDINPSTASVWCFFVPSIESKMLLWFLPSSPMPCHIKQIKPNKDYVLSLKWRTREKQTQTE